MSDHLVRALARDAGLLIESCISTELAREGARRHDASPLAAILLGRSLTATVMMGALLKAGQRMAVKIESNGPVAKLVTESNSRGRVRGYIDPAIIDLGSDSPSPGSLGIFGNVGVLSVTRDLKARELSEGAVPLEANDLDANLVVYYARSEQVHTAVQTGVSLSEENRIAFAGGLILQAMPGVDQQALQTTMDRLLQLPAPDMWASHGLSSRDVIAAVLADVDYEVLEEFPVHYRCTCSRERTQRALQMLGRDELLSLADEGEAVVDCHFCHERYIFSRAELTALAG